MKIAKLFTLLLLAMVACKSGGDENVDALKLEVRDILRSERTKKLVRALVAQSQGIPYFDPDDDEVPF